MLDASDPEVPRNLDVALAVASGSADAGVTARAGRRPVRRSASCRWPANRSTSPWAAADVSGLDPLVKALRAPTCASRIEALGGYDLAESGTAGRC